MEKKYSIGIFKGELVYPRSLVKQVYSYIKLGYINSKLVISRKNNQD